VEENVGAHKLIRRWDRAHDLPIVALYSDEAAVEPVRFYVTVPARDAPEAGTVKALRTFQG